MFSLFFVTLLPMASTLSYGAILPPIFVIGTSLPLMIATFLIWFFELDRVLVKRRGAIVQKMTGMVMLVLGILDAMTFWGP